MTRIKFLQRHRLVAWLLIIFFALIVPGCTSTTTPTPIDDSLLDRSFLTQQPCAAPCWHGLEQDKSSKEDILAVLKTLPFVDSSKIVEHVSELDSEADFELSYGCLGFDFSRCGYAVVDDGKLRKLSVFVRYGLTFSATVDQLGPPAYVVYSNYASINACIIQLYWPEKGIIASNNNSNSTKPCEALANGDGIDPNANVTSLQYNSTQDKYKITCCKYDIDVRIPWPGFTK
jgi:hypothetical protein